MRSSPAPGSPSVTGAQFEEQVSGLARGAVEESEKLRRGVGEAFEHGEREPCEAAEETGPES